MRVFMVSGYPGGQDCLPTDHRAPLSATRFGTAVAAMFSVARELAAIGHEVFVFHDTARASRFEGVDYLPRAAAPSLATHLEHDVLVSWDAPEILDLPLRSKATIRSTQLDLSSIRHGDRALALSWESELLSCIRREESRLGIRFPAEIRSPGTERSRDEAAAMPAEGLDGISCVTKRFRDRDFLVAHSSHDASWYTFDDELEFRESQWTIQPGEVVFDVGAAFGSYTLSALAVGAARVYAWSPEHERGLFAKTLQLNGYEDRCVVISSGVYDRDGYLDPLSQEFSLDPRPASIRVRRGDEVAAELAPERLDWIKIDVEGAELSALRGFEATIRKFHPKVVVENHVFKIPNVEQDVRDWMKQAGYQEMGTWPYGAISHSVYRYEAGPTT